MVKVVKVNVSIFKYFVKVVLEVYIGYPILALPIICSIKQLEDISKDARRITTV